MATTLTITELNKAAVALGRAFAFIAPKWDGATDLALTFLGHTNGDVVFTPNEGIRTTSAPEISPAPLKVAVFGAAPKATVPLFLADPALRVLVSPTGSGAIGTDGFIPVVRHTLVLMPAQLFFNAITNRNDAKVQYVGGVWQKSAVAVGDADDYVAMTSDETDQLGLSIWGWDGYWSRPPVTYRFGSATEEAVDVEACEFTLMMPDIMDVVGAMAHIGPPSDYGIEIDVT